MIFRLQRKQITIAVIGRRKNTLHRAVSLPQHGFLSIYRTETDKMAAKLEICKSRVISNCRSIVDVTDMTLDAASVSSIYGARLSLAWRVTI